MTKSIKHTNKIFVLILSVIMCILMAVPALAAYDSGAVIDTSHKGSLYIDYKDNIDGDDPIAGAEFTIYKVADIVDYGRYESLIPSLTTFDDIDAADVLDTVKSAYANGQVVGGYTTTGPTTAYGQLNFQNLDLGLYLLEESKPAVEHFASIPTFVALPHMNDNFTEWIYDITVEPKALPGGDLIIKKTVGGDAGETNRDFNFVVTFKNYAEPLNYNKSNGQKGTLKSGDTITLKHNESIIIDTIPVGTEYTVTEKEANTDGYTTTITGGTGNIRRTVQCVASFDNTKRTTVNTGDNYVLYISAAICFMAFLFALLLVDRLVHSKD